MADQLQNRRPQRAIFRVIAILCACMVLFAATLRLAHLGLAITRAWETAQISSPQAANHQHITLNTWESLTCMN